MTTVTLTQDQQVALEAIESFLKDPARTAFLLEGGAGTGKTFLLGEVLKNFRRGIRCCCTPTHKATQVLRRKLDAFGVPWQRGYDAYLYDGESVITGTTAQLLGIAPVVVDDQKAEEMHFGKSSKGILGKVTPALIVVDEVSMLGAEDLLDIIAAAKKKKGTKVLCVGDAAQLPPVKKQQIPFAKFKSQASLKQIVRQASDSAIVKVAWAIRDGHPWHELEGKGLSRVPYVVDAFLEAVQKPGELPEEERVVYVAYRNANVNSVMEKACQTLYGHGRLAFAPGELVLSNSNFYRNKQLLCANQDELVVEQFLEDERDEVTGTPVLLRPARERGTFRASYLTPEELANKGHPYNVELHRLQQEAQRLQQETNALKGRTPMPPTYSTVDSKRRQAWQDFFHWRDQTVISFSHPFAITSHKSQGSTYRAVYADVTDIARFSPQALYVAVTRPKELLVVPQ